MPKIPWFEINFGKNIDSGLRLSSVSQQLHIAIYTRTNQPLALKTSMNFDWLLTIRRVPAVLDLNLSHLIPHFRSAPSQIFKMELFIKIASFLTRFLNTILPLLSGNSVLSSFKHSSVGKCLSQTSFNKFCSRTSWKIL